MIQAGLALIFDMDGVLVHSNPVHRQAWVVFNKRYGLETTDAMHERMYGKRTDQIIRDFFGNELQPEEVTARGAAKEALYRELIGPKLDQHLVPGVRRLLESLNVTPVGLATNAESANVNFLLDGARLRPFFRVVVNGYEVERPKPDPEIYLRVASRLGVAPHNCVIFEDSYSGLAAGKSAGARVVGIRTTHEKFADADFEADDFLSQELWIWLKSQQFRS
jgi:beta-phosphoglucomutase family hydrolase